MNKLNEVIIRFIGIKFQVWEKDSCGREMLIDWEIESIKLERNTNSIDSNL